MLFRLAGLRRRVKIVDGFEIVMSYELESFGLIEIYSKWSRV
jgi:hypothetical protein